MIAPGVIQQLYAKWQECLDRNEGEVLKKIICIDGKTMHGNKRNGKKPAHKEDIELASRAIRGHWSAESMHWHLDVTFREDASMAIDKMAAQNLNIIRKWCLSILKVTELSIQKLSMKKKRFAISLRPTMLLDVVLNA